jgi:hypothetical protein
MTITIRPIANTDTEACGRIFYEAFKRAFMIGISFPVILKPPKMPCS